MNNKNSLKAKSHIPNAKLTSPWVYLAFVFLFSWAFTIPAALSGANLRESPLLMIAYAFAGLGPAVAAITLVYLTQDREGRRDYWRRMIDFRRIPRQWYAAIILLVPAQTALAAWLDWLLGGTGLKLELAARFLEQPLLILPYALFYLLFGPLPEEIGWRGYALDRLQIKRSALAASLILGAAWASWHVPQFFVPGTYQYGLGFGTPSFWIFMTGGTTVSAIFYTWFYNNTGRSTLSAILFHFMQNFTGELFELSGRAEFYNFILTIAAAILIVLIWGPKTLTTQKKPKS